MNIDQLYDNIETTRIDELTAEQCASMSTTHYDYSTLASHIVISNLHKNTGSSFYNAMKKLYEFNCGEAIRFEADSPEGIVSEMERIPSYNNSTGDAFIRSKAEILSVYSGKPIRFDSAESFTDDLITLGMLREIENAKK